MPRHPPCALKNLTTKDQNQHLISREPQIRKQIQVHQNCFFIRCSRPLCSSQTTTPSHPSPNHVFTVARTRTAQETRNNQQPAPKDRPLLPQDPTVCQTITPGQPPHVPGTPPKRDTVLAWKPPRDNLSVDIPPSSTHRRTNACAMGSPADRTTTTVEGRAKPEALLRKEVIQPHLPVRLPCYDLVPIAGPTFDGSLPKGLGHRLRVLPTFVT